MTQIAVGLGVAAIIGALFALWVRYSRWRTALRVAKLRELQKRRDDAVQRGDTREYHRLIREMNEV